MTRRPVPEMSGPSQIRPVASPVDTFIRTPQPSPSPLHEVAEGLAAFDQGLRGFLDKRREKQNDADRIRGEAAFNRANQTGWAEAVREGLVPANASPIFQESYKRAQGNLAGIRLREKFNTAYMSWEGRNSDHPGAFEEFVSTFIAGNIGTDDPHILAGLNPHIEALTNDAYNARISEVGKATYNGNVNTQAALAGESIDYANQDGLSTGEGTDYEGLRGDLLAQREEVLSSGVRMEDYDAAMVKAIAAKAIEHQDPQLLDVLDEVWPGYDDVKLSSIPAFRDIKQGAIEAIEVDIRQRMNENSKAQKDADDAAEAKIVTHVFTALDVDPTAEVPEDIIKAWEKYDPAARTKLARARKSLQDADALESREDLLMVEQYIQDGATQKDIFELVAENIITNPTTLKTVLDRVERRRKANLEGSGILRTQTSKRFLETIKERTTDELGEMLFMPEGLTDEGLEATKDFEMMLIDWEEKNPNASLKDREQAINEIGELVLKRIAPQLQGKVGPQYISPADAARMREEADQQEEGQQSEASGEPGDEPEDEETEAEDFFRIPSREEFRQGMRIDSGIRVPREQDTERRKAWEQEQIQEHFTGDEPPKFEDLDPAFQDTLRSHAEQRDMDPEEFTTEFWKKVNEVINRTSGTDGTDGGNPQAETVEGNVEKSSFQPDEVQADVSDTIEDAIVDGATRTASAVSDDRTRKASPVLDLLGHTEGTDKGRGYNETLGYGRYTGGDVDLVNMTLGEIDTLQTRMLVHPDNRLQSSALGRYQIVRTTLRGLKKNLGLSDDEKFTPELQDRLAMELLRTRGYDKWLAGKMSNEAFMNSIAKEWASLPTDQGRSYYGQRTVASSRDVLSAFDNVLNNRVGLGGGKFGQTGTFAYDHGKASGDLTKILTASDRGYKPDMDNVKDDVKTRLVAVQEEFGEQIPVVSGYRDPARNARAGGAKESMHTKGKAIDVSVRDWPFEKRLRLIRAASKAGFKGIGVYANSLHFDTGRKRYWGPSHRSSSLPKWAVAVIEEHMAQEEAA